MRVLVIEDEVRMARLLKRALEEEGHAVDIAGDGPEGLWMATENAYAAVVLDVMLPGFDGLEVCRRIQGRRPVPVLMLTARADETDMLVGLGVGADDYLTKPFSMRVLTARVHALLRRVERSSSVPDTRIVLGDLEIDVDQRRVARAGVAAQLTPIEFDLLVHFARRPRVVQPRERLLSEVWDWDVHGTSAGTRAVDSHIKALRRKLGADLIRTVHGVGYALEAGS
jgi:DNA-binding response OmpR family regulator